MNFILFKNILKICINHSTPWIYFMSFMGFLPQPGSKPAWIVADFQHRLVLMTFKIFKMLCLGDHLVVLVRKSSCISWANQYTYTILYIYRDIDSKKVDVHQYGLQ